MIRNLVFLLLIAGSLAARASDPLTAPTAGNSATVIQPHVTAELIPEKTLVDAGQPFDIILHLHSDPGWHTYWINPGDAGLATSIIWTLPPGFTAGPIQWPTPEKHNMGPLITYGYAGDVYLLTTITPSDSSTSDVSKIEITAHASWLVCQEECIPGKADLSIPLHFAGKNAQLDYKFQWNRDLFAAARARLPVPNTRWKVTAKYEDKEGIQTNPPQQLLGIRFGDLTSANSAIGNIYFFPEQGNVLNADWTNAVRPRPDEVLAAFYLAIPLQQNGDKPNKLSGVLVSNQPLIGNASAVYISEFPVSGVAAAGPAAVPSSDEQSAAQRAAATGNADDGHRPPLQTEQPLLLAVLGAAFIGGLILNLMPCVLPVLSLKVFSLMKHAGENPKAAWIQGVAFTAGVVLSFWVLAGLLLTLRAAGNHLGWGFQMQSPGFVLALILLFFLLALNLFGVFELGASLVGLDAKATGHLGGVASSFGNGALATLAATPCTAPFMGSALGFAAQQPAFISLLIFTFLAFGMATPYLLLTIFPGALRLVPKPGAWMEAFKQFMGFLLMATVIFLVYVFGALVGQEQIPWLLSLILLAGLIAWIYGRWVSPQKPTGIRFTGAFYMAILTYILLKDGVALARTSPLEPRTGVISMGQESQGWQPWSQSAVDQALAKGQPVFVDFTAAWCLSCKVNEAVALGTDAVKQAFAQKNVALFRADWTHSDPEISKTLQKFHRDGVPLYLLYSPKAKDAPQVLPEVLTPGIVLDALNKL